MRNVMCNFMRPLIIICAFFIMTPAWSQDTGKRYFFEEIGWTITLPSNFKPLDSIENAKTNERGLKAIQESNGLTVDMTQLKTLIAAHKDAYNYFNSTIRPFNSKVEGTYDSASKVVKDMMYKTFLDNMPSAKIDSVTTNETIDGVLFDKFHVTITLTGNFIMNMILLSKYYKGYDFGISYLYLDEKTKEQIELMLKNSKFKK